MAFIIVKDDAVLAERRKRDKPVAPGILALPGGHVDAGETIPQALARELREELGVEAHEPRLVCRRIHRSTENRHLHYYAIEEWDGELQCREAESLRWVRFKDVEYLDLQVDREALSAYLSVKRRVGRSGRLTEKPAEIARARARDMRGAMTDAERKLWGQLNRKQMLGVRFRRQVPLGHYIVDFVCLPARLVVEVDGGQHTVERDAARSAWLESQGFVVLRFWNGDVLTGIDRVVETIHARVAEILSTPPPTPSRKGRG